MNPKKKRLNKQAIHRKVTKIFVNDDKFARNQLSEEETSILYKVGRDRRFNMLFEELHVDKNDLKKAKNKHVSLYSQSQDSKSKKQKFKHILNDYYGSIIKEGIFIGIGYGKKFIVAK